MLDLGLDQGEHEFSKCMRARAILPSAIAVRKAVVSKP